MKYGFRIEVHNTKQVHSADTTAKSATLILMLRKPQALSYTAFYHQCKIDKA